VFVRFANALTVAAIVVATGSTAFAQAAPSIATPSASPSSPAAVQASPVADDATAAPSPRPVMHGRLRAALASLDLTPDQQTKIRSIMQRAHASRMTATPMTHEAEVAAIEAVLTPDQRTSFEAAMQPARRTHPAFRRTEPSTAPSSPPTM